MQNSRRKPSQQRGKQRFDTIVAATHKLVGEKGSDDVSIRDIAKEADVAPSSIYQYFDDKNAILLSIMEEYFDRNFEWLSDRTSAAETLADWVNAIEESLDFFIDTLRDDPGWMIIWNGIQATPSLRDYDNADAMRNAQLLQQQLRHFCPHIPHKEALAVCALFVQMVPPTAKMSLWAEPEMEVLLINEFKNLVRTRVRALSV